MPAGTVLGDFWMFDAISFAWIKLELAGAPAARIGLGLVSVRSKLYLHGGASERGISSIFQVSKSSIEGAMQSGLSGKMPACLR